MKRFFRSLLWIFRVLISLIALKFDFIFCILIINSYTENIWIIWVDHCGYSFFMTWLVSSMLLLANVLKLRLMKMLPKLWIKSYVNFAKIVKQRVGNLLNISADLKVLHIFYEYGLRVNNRGRSYHQKRDRFLRDLQNIIFCIYQIIGSSQLSMIVNVHDELSI